MASTWGDSWGTTWASSWESSGVVVVPPPTIDYQTGTGGGYAGRKRKKTQQLFDDLERTINLAFYGEEPGPVTVAEKQAPKAIIQPYNVDSALRKMAELAYEDEFFRERFARIKAAFLAYRRELEDEDDFIMMQ